MSKIKVSQLVTVCLPLLFVFAQYKFFSINIGFLLLQMVSFVAFICKPELRIEKNFLLFILSIYLVVFFSYFYSGMIYNGTIFYYASGLLLVFVVLIMSSYANLSKMYDWYKLVGGFITVVVFFQGVYILITGSELAPIRLLPVSQDIERVWLPSPRPSGFFSEPQLYASFVLPLFLLSVLKKDYLLCFLLLLGILVSGSTYGLMIALVLSFWLVLRNGHLTNVKSWFGLLFLSGIFISIFFSTGLFDSAYEKLLRTDITQGIRVAKSPILFWEMSFVEKIIGMRSSVEDFIRVNINSFLWLAPYVEADSHLLGYVTGLFGLGIYFGIVPMLLYMWFLIRSFLKGDKFQQGMVIIILLHSISATILFNAYFVFFFVLLFSFSYDGSSKLRYWNFYL